MSLDDEQSVHVAHTNDSQSIEAHEEGTSFHPLQAGPVISK